MVFHMVSALIFVPFSYNSLVCQTYGQTDRQNSHRCIPCSAVKSTEGFLNTARWEGMRLLWNVVSASL